MRVISLFKGWKRTGCFPDSPVAKTSPSDVAKTSHFRVQIRSLVKELRPYMPHGPKTKTHGNKFNNDLKKTCLSSLKNLVKDKLHI